jgi:hypothetical protein
LTRWSLNGLEIVSSRCSWGAINLIFTIALSDNSFRNTNQPNYY